MSKIGNKRRKFIIKLRRQRREKIKKLVERYKNASSIEMKTKILEKALRVNPNLTEESFLSRIK